MLRSILIVYCVVLSSRKILLFRFPLKLVIILILIFSPMCVNRKYIYNRYIRRSLLVDCGKCPSCLQQKACYRASRIRNNYIPGYITLFVTLTYRNEFVPFIYEIDIVNQPSEVSVYRECSGRNVRVSADYKTDYVYEEDYPCLGTFKVTYNDSVSFSNLNYLNGRRGRFGVLLYKDLQDFFKRLRINLLRHYNYDKPFYSFQCSEYGPSTDRPHFHTLIQIPWSDEQIFRDAIAESWPYDDDGRKARSIEIAKDAATYVSSYVNRSSGVSRIFKDSPFDQKHSYSKDFGHMLNCFRLSNLLAKADDGDITYVRQVKRPDGRIDTVTLPIPEYILSRYWPKFKGYSRISPSALESIVLNPKQLRQYMKEFDYSASELHAIYVRLANCYKRFHAISGLSKYDWAYYYDRIWRKRSSWIIGHQYDSVTSLSDYSSFYDNIVLFTNGIVRNESLSNLKLTYFNENPNTLPYVVSKTNHLTDLYLRLDKHRKVKNLAMQGLGVNV